MRCSNDWNGSTRAQDRCKRCERGRGFRAGYTIGHRDDNPNSRTLCDYDDDLFYAIIIVLGFVSRNAIGVNAAPSSQIIIGLGLFLTFFIMGPIWNKIYDDAVTPYMEKAMKSSEALDVATAYMKDFMMNQTRQEDAQFFLEISRQGAMTRDELPLSIVVPSFILSELRTAFQMGFLIFIPFIVVDFIVASTLMSMGMMMMPPVVISMPFKLLLFVLVDGWYLIVQSLVESFNVS